jgi:hypothetical protein
MRATPESQKVHKANKKAEKGKKRSLIEMELISQRKPFKCSIVSPPKELQRQ